MSVTSEQGIESVVIFFEDCSVFLLRKFGKTGHSSVVRGKGIRDKNIRSKHIETKCIEECASLCGSLGLQFVELHMNLPQYQTSSMDLPLLKELSEKYGIIIRYILMKS